jgi:hypothetical protein
LVFWFGFGNFVDALAASAVVYSFKTREGVGVILINFRGCECIFPLYLLMKNIVLYGF